MIATVTQPGRKQQIAPHEQIPPSLDRHYPEILPAGIPFFAFTRTPVSCNRRATKIDPDLLAGGKHLTGHANVRLDGVDRLGSV